MVDTIAVIIAKIRRAEIVLRLRYETESADELDKVVAALSGGGMGDGWLPSGDDWIDSNSAKASRDWRDGWDACRNRALAAPKVGEACNGFGGGCQGMDCPQCDCADPAPITQPESAAVVKAGEGVGDPALLASYSAVFASYSGTASSADALSAVAEAEQLASRLDSSDPQFDDYTAAAAMLRNNARIMAEKDSELTITKADYLNACKTVADMHAAAVGTVGNGPARGVVEDVEDVRLRAEAAEARADALEEQAQQLIDDGHRNWQAEHDHAEALAGVLQAAVDWAMPLADAPVAARAEWFDKARALLSEAGK